MEFSVHDSVASVGKRSIDVLAKGQSPFTQYAFLHALEHSKSVSAETGWIPQHVFVADEKGAAAFMPCYLKFHSFGEYIFDFAWADAAERAGINYYPKLLSAVPFTPASGRRILLREGLELAELLPSIHQAILHLFDKHKISSWHLLFCQEREANAFSDFDALCRLSYQFHWKRQVTWSTFEDYLLAMRSSARKQIRKERRVAQSHGFDLRIIRPEELTAEHINALYRFYQNTVDDKFAHAYLTRDFFEELQRNPENFLATFAFDQGKPVAAALFFHKANTLYGRYWGADIEADSLHFELCYYLPIEWCLEQGIDYFEAGAQGTHKIKRGFLPASCYSAHLFQDTRLASAVARFIRLERKSVEQEMSLLSQHSPFKQTATDTKD
ncbi:MAG: GNAT family N-acetyltransferase [Myxococcales bacterium]|nr:MAG: GNAT family N-acetyltransferase [Myxococcales bacterium]